MPTSEDTVDVQRSLGRVEGKIDLILSGMQNHLLEDTARFDKIATRQDIFDVRQEKTDRKIWLFAGGMASLLFIVQNSDSIFKLIKALKSVTL